MSLAEQIEKDLHGVFLNTNDFARPKNWNGQTVTVVEDRDKLAELKAKRDDLRTATHMLYIAEADLKAAPKVNSYVSYEGKRHRVTEVSVEEGMYVVVLTEVS